MKVVLLNHKILKIEKTEKASTAIHNNTPRGVGWCFSNTQLVKDLSMKVIAKKGRLTGTPPAAASAVEEKNQIPLISDH